MFSHFFTIRPKDLVSDLKVIGLIPRIQLLFPKDNLLWSTKNVNIMVFMNWVFTLQLIYYTSLTKILFSFYEFRVGLITQHKDSFTIRGTVPNQAY